MGQTDQAALGSTASSAPSSGVSTASTTRVRGVTQIPTIDENEAYEDDWSGWYDDYWDDEGGGEE